MPLISKCSPDPAAVAVSLLIHIPNNWGDRLCSLNLGHYTCVWTSNRAQKAGRPTPVNATPSSTPKPTAAYGTQQIYSWQMYTIVGMHAHTWHRVDSSPVVAHERWEECHASSVSYSVGEMLPHTHTTRQSSVSPTVLNTMIVPVCSRRRAGSGWDSPEQAWDTSWRCM